MWAAREFVGGVMEMSRDDEELTTQFKKCCRSLGKVKTVTRLDDYRTVTRPYKL